jgi:DNA-directed RNA polymerase specialized sigma24 family protein
MEKNSEITEKLDTIIKLLALGLVKGKEVKEQILFLYNLGISNKEIAQILGKTQNTVNATLSQQRRKKDEKEE